MAKPKNIKLVRLRGRNQITLPASVIKALALEEDDYLAVVSSEEDGLIRLRPAKVVTAGTPEGERAMQRAEADLAAGRSIEFDGVDEFAKEMLSDHRQQMEELEQAEEPGAEPQTTVASESGILGRVEPGGTGAGSLQEVATVLKSLEKLSSSKPLSFREKKMLERAKQLLISELAAARNATMLVHVAATSTSASVQRGGFPVFTRIIKLGSANATSGELAEEVRKTIEFFEVTAAGSRVGTVFLSVGPPAMPSLAAELAKTLHLPVREFSALREVYVSPHFDQSVNIKWFPFDKKITTQQK